MKEDVLTPGLSIVEEEGSLGSNDDQVGTPAPATLIDSDEVQYEFREEGGLDIFILICWVADD